MIENNSIKLKRFFVQEFNSLILILRQYMKDGGSERWHLEEKAVEPDLMETC